LLVAVASFAAAGCSSHSKTATTPAPGAIFAVPVADAVAAGQVLGPASAPVTIVKACDFACPYCAQLNAVLEEIVSEYNGKVRVVYENMVVHPFAMAVHLGSCAAGKQGKYLAFKKVIWEETFPDYVSARRDPRMLDEVEVIAAGKAAGLDTVKMQRDLASAACKQRIAADMRELERFGANGTPTLFINGTLTTGRSNAALRRAIDEKLKVVAASRVPSSDYYAEEVIGKGEKQFRSKGGK
jgi:protein-disulfide isomerase